MKVLALTCANCGAPLEFPAGGGKSPCRICCSWLEIDPMSREKFTWIPQSSNLPSRENIRDSYTLLLWNRLRQIHREWADVRKRVSLRGLHSEYYLFRMRDGLILVATGMALGLFSMLSRLIAPGNPVLLISGLLSAAACMLAGFTAAQMADDYKKGREKYERRSREILGILQKRRAM